MKRYYHYFTYLILIINGCVTSNPHEVISIPKIIVSPENNSPMYFSDFFQSGEVITLNSKDTIVNNIWRLFKLKEDQGKYLLWASRADYQVHILDSAGKIKSIIRKGKGPEELNTIGSMFVENGRIYVFDRMLSKIFVYSENGETLETIRLPIAPGHYSDYQIIDSTSAVFYKSTPTRQNDFKLDIVDRIKYNVKESLLPQFQPDLVSERHFQQVVNLYNFHDTVCFFESFSNIVYNVLPNNITSRYSFDFGKHKLPDELYENKNLKLVGFVEKCVNSNYIWNVNDFFEANDFIFFTYNYNKKRFFSFYNKKEGKCISSDEFHDNILTQIIEKDISPMDFYPIGIIDHSIYFVIESYYLIEKLDEIKTQQSSVYEQIINSNAVISQVYKSINMDSNPLIVKYTFK